MYIMAKTFHSKRDFGYTDIISQHVQRKLIHARNVDYFRHGGGAMLNEKFGIGVDCDCIKIFWLRFISMFGRTEGLGVC